MGFFITEKQTEKWLKLETRVITMPNGKQRPFTMFKLIWRSFDYLIREGNYTEKELVMLSVQNAEGIGEPFEESFPNVLAYIHHRVRQQKGID